MTNDFQVAIRIEEAVAARADALVARMSAAPAYRGFRMSRAAVLRAAMMEGLAALEQRYAAELGEKKPRKR